MWTNALLTDQTQACWSSQRLVAVAIKAKDSMTHIHDSESVVHSNYICKFPFLDPAHYREIEL